MIIFTSITIRCFLLISIVLALFLTPASAQGRMIYYFVDDAVYSSAAAEIERFMNDVNADTGSQGQPCKCDMDLDQDVDAQDLRLMAKRLGKLLQ